jgi:hypothetical protein
MINDLAGSWHSFGEKIEGLVAEHKRVAERPFNEAAQHRVAVQDDEALALTRAKDELASLHLRDTFFDIPYFGDPAWRMLLDLYIRQRNGLDTSVSATCIAANVPPTTALRYIGTLERHGWIERRPDPDDLRRVYVVLSAQTITRLTQLLAKDARRLHLHP